MDFSTALAASNEAGIEFLKTELSLANTFLDTAETLKVPEHRFNCHKDAQTAYRSILKFLPRLRLSTAQRLEFNQVIAALKERLLHAGIEPHTL